MARNKTTESGEDGKTGDCNERVENAQMHWESAGKKELKLNEIMGKNE